MSERVTEMSRFDTKEPAEPKVVAECAYCSGDITEGEYVHRVNDSVDVVHYEGNCAEQYAFERVYDRQGTIDSEGNVN
jgi:hypothetical protein